LSAKQDALATLAPEDGAPDKRNPLTMRREVKDKQIPKFYAPGAKVITPKSVDLLIGLFEFLAEVRYP